MLDKIYFKNSHLTSLAYLMLETDGFDMEEKQLVLAHINSCTECMKRYVESLTDDSLIEPESSLQSNIISVIHSHENEKKNSKILAIQFAKLGIAVCLTMVIFFSGALGFSLGTSHRLQNDVPITEQQKPKSKLEKKGFNLFDEITSNINRGFLGFADQINIGFKGDAKDGAK